MTFDEMLTFTVDGGKATCDLLNNGYVHYPFNGWRIGYENGSGSGFSFDDALKAAEWREYVEPVKAWADLPTIIPEAAMKAYRDLPPAKRRGRPPKAAEPLPVNDIGDWQQKPLDKPAKPASVNPWLELKPQKQGWSSYD